MDIPQGYKQTELGIIPEDWEVVVIGEQGILQNRSVNPQQEPHKIFCEYSMPSYDNDKIPIYRCGNEMYSSRFAICSPVLLFNKLNVRQKRIWFLENTPSDSICSMEFLPYSSDSIDLLLLSHILGTDQSTEYFVGLSKGTSNSQKRIRPIDFISKKIAIPSSLAEQQTIAEALSDIDGLIAALDKKIAKKHLIKQGAMQQLLTGKKRLPGFTDPWVEKRLGEIGVWVKGQSLSKNDIIPNGKNICIHYGELFSYGEVITLPVSRTNCQPTTISLGNEILFPDSDVTPDGLGRCSALLIKGVIIGSGINVLRHKPLYDTSFVSYSININRSKIIDRVTGTTVKHINSKELSEIMINIPKNKEEQTAIATILTDTDKEIADLEAKRDKYRLLKSGMMQKLLTGQIRLTKPLTNVVHLVPESSAAREIPVDAHILAGHIVNRLWQSKGWGRTKLQKSLHLIGYCVQLNLGNEYIRNTAGPDDQLLMNYIDRKFKQYRHVNIKKERRSDGTVHYSYIPTPLIQELEMAYEQYPQIIREHIDVLLDKLSTMNLAGAEILSTLYAVWNNRIIKGEQITDDLLLADFYAWSQHKADFEERRVRKALDYMRKENIVPIGWGKYIDKKMHK